ncbi:5-oxoprolinase subunit PxpB [Polaribacter sp. R77954]|uniref:5-oxoprolinase subunit PxpB n=1 Tax=Polaribacter sp. R77954 TaxID=3093870 RepID=UPI0037CAB0C1
MGNNITYKRFGEKAILMEWKAIIDDAILKDILEFQEKIKFYNQAHVIDVIQGYHSLTIIYQNKIFDFTAAVNHLKTIYASTLKKDKQQLYQWEIPVCYDLEFGIDLVEISNTKNKSIDEVIKLHVSAIYTIYFIGFLPGFLYLGGLPEQLYVSRKSNPRLHVAKGAVGIGGKQTGVYPNKSAGGWNIIGKTPINFFDVAKQNPCFAKAGDTIKFNSISLEDYKYIASEIKQQKYQLIKTVQNA